ncbi:MAG: histone H1 [Bacteroidales bacterium]|nr:histone H1 [Bacteroidales bacterium]
MEALVAKIKAEIDAFVVNADAQVAKGNKAAGARARKAALDLMKDLKEFRKISIAETKK